MNNLRDIKNRLRSIRKNEQILRAMKMVSAVKLRRIQQIVQQSRPYAERMEALVQDLMNAPDVREQRPVLLQRRIVHKALWVVLSTDRGLCGGLNTALFRYVLKAIRERAGGPGAVALLLIGQKAGAFFKRVHAGAAHLRVEQAYPLAETQADILGRQLCDLYRNGRVDQVDLFYSRCKSQLQQIPSRVALLPIMPAEHPAEGGLKHERLFEPAPAVMAEYVLPRYVTSRIRQILFEEQVAEHSARMVMMDQASKSAGDMIEQIQLDFNKLRQFMITRELTDITTGVEAMA